MQFDLNELRDLLMSLQHTDISELTLKADDLELVVKRDGGSTTQAVTATGLIPNQGFVNTSVPAPAVIPTPTPQLANQGSAQSEAIATQPEIPVPAANTIEIKSPMVGTFYRAPAPDEDPFVSLGDRVKIGQTVCILEAMKLMNELEADVAGEVVEILVENGQPVEFDQVLMRVIPA
ncbi:MAG: acetyl-CoA carboxylase biotin carboxyl carrier protein [Cyanobacteria bacterium P01_H01_bin.121]